MASTFSTNLRLELIGTGDQSGTWGSTTNTNLGTLLEQAISGVAAVSMTSDADYTLTTANGAADQARQAVLSVTSTVSLTATRNVIVPTVNKTYIVKNGTTGGQSIVVKTSAGTGITVTNGSTTAVYCDGTNIVSALNYLPTLNYTTAVGVTSETVPLVIGGTAASSTLTLESTSGVGTSDAILFKTGSQNERMRIDTSGNVGIGTSSLTSKFTVAGAASLYTSTNSSAGSGYVLAVTGTGAKASTTDNTNFAIFSNDALASNPLSLAISVVGNATTASRYAYLQAGEYGTGTVSTLALNPNGGNVGIGTTSPSASAILDAQSTTKGVRFPNMTTTQKNAISSPAAGLVVFDTTLAKLCVYSGSAWQTITSI